MQLFVDHLTVIDCSLLHPDHGITGQSWICDVLLEGPLNAQSMVMDFGHVKKRLKQAIDAAVDHRLLVPQRSAQLRRREENTLYWCDTKAREWCHTAPAEAVCVLDAQAVTRETLTAHLETVVLPEALDETVSRVAVTLREEAIDGPYYRYSHGLKKHDGNCQRIAHGHRSKLEIRRNGETAPQLAQHWCARWAHIYLVSQEDIIRRDEQTILSGYDAPQGRFELLAPADACDILPGDSTVECIAQHMAQTLKTQEPEAAFTVRAFEGVHKGAIVSL